MATVRTGNFKIPLAQPDLGISERTALLEAFDSGWVSWRGPHVEAFEEQFAAYIGTKHAVAVSSGTTALHLALLACDIGPNHEVLIPDLTYVATANAVLYTGAKPVFCEIDGNTWTLSCTHAKHLIRKQTKAIITVHLFGETSHMTQLQNLASEHNLYLIEDCAQSLGSEYFARRLGSIGDLGCFSFFANKTITTGEGGMIVTNSQARAEHIRQLRNHCAGKNYSHSMLGYNYRMTNLQAAIGCAQLARIPEFIEARQHIAKHYKINLNPTFGRQIKIPGCRFVRWLYTALTGDRDNFIKHMANHNIEVKPAFKQMTTLPYFRSKFLPVSEHISNQAVMFPTYTQLSDAELEYIINVANSFKGEK